MSDVGPRSDPLGPAGRLLTEFLFRLIRFAANAGAGRRGAGGALDLPGERREPRGRRKQAALKRPLYLCLRGTSAQGRKVMSTIAEWLASLGMSEYAERFIENKIDISVLRHLT